MSQNPAAAAIAGEAMQAARLSLPAPPMDRLQFSERIRTHHRALYAYALAICRSDVTARELVQDAFVAAWQSLGAFDITRDFASWLRGIVRNKWREYCRRHARETPLDEESLSRLEEILTPHPAGDAALFERLSECREKLPAAMQEAVSLCYDEGRSSDDAATVLNIAPPAFRKRLERAREALRVCLSKNS